jgi:hypothetical protein
MKEINVLYKETNEDAVGTDIRQREVDSPQSLSVETKITYGLLTVKNPFSKKRQTAFD